MASTSGELSLGSLYTVVLVYMVGLRIQLTGTLCQPFKFGTVWHEDLFYFDFCFQGLIMAFFFVDILTLSGSSPDALVSDCWVY